MNAERIAIFRSTMELLGLDIVLAYSTRFASTHSLAIAGVPCRSAGNYLVISPNDLYFVEVGYKAEDLRARTSLPVVTVSDENLYPEFIAKMCKNLSAIGIIGPVPYLHLSSISASIRELSTYMGPALRKKTRDEIAALKSAYVALKTTIKEVCLRVHEGQTEQELATALRSGLSKHADRLGFDPLIASGSRLSTSTFLSPSNRRFRRDDYICLDIGIVIDGFYTDTTVSFRLGASSDPTIGLLERLQREVISEIKEGTPINQVASIYQNISSGLGIDFNSIPIEDLGHFIGFELHEPPFFVTQESRDIILEEGHLFCLEPQITVSDIHLRTEEMVVISNGRAVPLDDWN